MAEADRGVSSSKVGNALKQIHRRPRAGGDPNAVSSLLWLASVSVIRRAIKIAQLWVPACALGHANIVQG